MKALLSHAISTPTLFAALGALLAGTVMAGACGTDDSAFAPSTGGGTASGGNAATGGSGGTSTNSGGAGGAATGGAGGQGVETPCGICGPGEQCDLTLGCVDCLDDDDCMGTGTPICVLGECEECGSNADCGAQVCDPADHECVDGCAGPGDCTNGDANICNDTLGACVECEDANDCPDDPVCNTVLGICGECESDGDCGAGEPKCDVADARCRECLLTSDCGAGQVCVDNSCEDTCLDDGDCDGDEPVCETGSGVCVECLDGNDCDGGQPHCDASLSCVECLNDDHCSGDQDLCSAKGECVECRLNTDCGNDEECKNGDCEATQ